MDNVVPDLTREEEFRSVQPLECAVTNIETDVKSLVPAPMREDADETVQPLDSAGTYRMATMRVPAPMKEEAFGSVQPLECAWTNVETDLKSLVPAPRLELQSGRAGPESDLVHHLMNLAPDLLSELRRGRFETTKEMLEIFVELSEKFQNLKIKFLKIRAKRQRVHPGKGLALLRTL